MSGNIIPVDYSSMKFEKALTADDISIVVRNELMRSRTDNSSIVGCCCTLGYSITVISLLVVIYLTVTKINGHIDDLMSYHNITMK